MLSSIYQNMNKAITRELQIQLQKIKRLFHSLSCNSLEGQHNEDMENGRFKISNCTLKKWRNNLRIQIIPKAGFDLLKSDGDIHELKICIHRKQ